MGRVKSHYTKPVAVELVDDDGEKYVFDVYPLGWKFLPKLIAVIKRMNSLGLTRQDLTEEKATEVAVELLGDEVVAENVYEVVKHVVGESMPEMLKDEKAFDEFAALFGFQIFMAAVEASLKGGVGGESGRVPEKDRVAASQKRKN